LTKREDDPQIVFPEGTGPLVDLTEGRRDLSFHSKNQSKAEKALKETKGREKKNFRQPEGFVKRLEKNNETGGGGKRGLCLNRPGAVGKERGTNYVGEKEITAKNVQTRVRDRRKVAEDPEIHPFNEEREKKSMQILPTLSRRTRGLRPSRR